MALSANKKRSVKAPNLAVKETILLADSQTVYEGALININASGLALVASDTASEVSAGVAVAAVSSGTSNSTKFVTVERGQTEWFVKGAGITVADIGAAAVVTDDAVVTDAGAGTNDVKVGRIVAVETIDGTAGCWVEVGKAVM
mgnify:CR=1 FL=1